MQSSTHPAIDKTVSTALARPGSGALVRARTGTATWRALRRSWQLYAMLLLPLTWLIVFAYVPLCSSQIAFLYYNVFAGVSGSPSVGLKHFDRFVHSYNFCPILKNTLLLNLYQLAAGFPLPIMFALALNYVTRHW